jgi:hypothetical protein
VDVGIVTGAREKLPLEDESDVKLVPSGFSNETVTEPIVLLLSSTVVCA